MCRNDKVPYQRNKMKRYYRVEDTSAHNIIHMGFQCFESSPRTFLFGLAEMELCHLDTFICATRALSFILYFVFTAIYKLYLPTV